MLLRVHRFAVLTAILVHSAGCTLFYPRFDPFVSNQTAAAFEEVSELTSAIELGKYGTAESFDGAIDSYASIDAKLATAALRIDTLTAPTGPSRAARDGIKAQIEGCRARVKALADIHKATGVPPGVGATQPVLVSCDQATRAADAMK